ncbi:MAG: nitrous oxidase accessory protein [Cyclobacteriaceae bacterium]|jgi:nitrous oxidase accessory protein
MKYAILSNYPLITNKFTLTAFLMILMIHVSANTIKVCNGCQTSELSTALNMSAPFDTIKLSPGTYHSINNEITKPITLIGKGATLDGGDEGYILRVLADSVSIIGIRFINAGKSYTKDFAAIYLYRSSFFHIEDNVIINPFFGLLVEKSSNGLIKNNLIYGESQREDDSGNGIHLWHCNNVIIESNEIHGLRDGIYFEFVEFSIVKKNISHHNIRYGLHFMFSNNDQYLDNTFRDNGAGVAVMFSKFIVMKSNRFEKNWGTASYGLLLKEIYDAEVIENTFEENTIGIFIEGSTRINYTSNRMVRNGWAVKVSGGCYKNAFVKNEFMGNSFDVSYNGNINDNYFDQNYWDSYTGYDLDHDGKGDIPHRPVKLFSYVANQTPETIILLRSLFVEIINFSEKVSPVFTPDNLVDHAPSMRQSQ